jgi:hypothetical protein
VDKTLCKRHLSILEVLVNRVRASQQKAVPRAVYMETLCREHNGNDWHFWHDTSGQLQSTDVDDDITYLHLRGYLRATSNPHAIPTYRAVRALRDGPTDAQKP